MPGETADIRVQTRRVKKLALDRAERILTNPQDYSSDLYNQTYLTALKSSIPQTREITGEDGEAINVSITKYGDTTTASIPAESLPAPSFKSI